jgi:hypothetical protein
LEKVPHWNPHINTELKENGKITPRSLNIIITDSSIALLSGIYIASLVLPNYSHAATIIAASFFASLPDLAEIPYYFLGSKNNIIKSWVKFQKSIQEDTSMLTGLATQAVVVIAAFLWIIM